MRACHRRSRARTILDRHGPYAAVVLDRYANCLMGNRAAGRLPGALVDPSLLTEHANHLRLLFHPLGARRWMVNWPEVARHIIARTWSAVRSAPRPDARREVEARCGS